MNATPRIGTGPKLIVLSQPIDIPYTHSPSLKISLLVIFDKWQVAKSAAALRDKGDSNHIIEVKGIFLGERRE